MWLFILTYWWQIYLAGFLSIPVLWSFARYITGQIKLAQLKKRAISLGEVIRQSEIRNCLSPFPGFFKSVVYDYEGGILIAWILWPVMLPLTALYFFSAFVYGNVKYQLEKRKEKAIEKIEKDIAFMQKAKQTGVSDASISPARMTGGDIDRGLSVVSHGN